ncbi:MAG: DegT/DnrJ/EryC1/StrS family aminotransferase, partial [Bacteroidota bacterium]
ESLEQVVLNHSPFRYYGPALQGKTAEFEKKAADLLGVKHALAVSSGTASLVVSLRAMGVGPGDEVIVPAVTFIACAGSVVACKAIPVFCDVDNSLNIDPDALEKLITPRTKVIMVVHLQGMSADMNRIMKIAEKHQRMVLEDCAQSFGATYQGRPVGSIGHVGTFSLQINKTITAGEGGLVVTNDDNLYKRMIIAHDQGNIRDAAGHVVVDESCPGFFGENYRMSELTGAVALIQVKKVNGIINNMRSNAKKIIAGLKDLSGLRWRENYSGDGASFVSLTVYLPNAAATIQAEKECREHKVPGIRLYQGLPIYAYPFVLQKLTNHPSGCPFTCPLYKGPAIEYRMGMCPKAEDLISRALFVQVSPLLTDDDIDYIVSHLKQILAKLI